MKNLNRRNIVKWYKMLTGKSILHVNQGEGKLYSKNSISGYYNDLTEKVLKDVNFSKIEIPKIETENGDKVVFPIAVFQYGLGSYDLYLESTENIYLEKFELMANWALENQESSGAWNNFFYVFPDSPYSAMAQGEGASLLIRAYKEFNEDKYLEAAKKAIEFMLIPIEEGGTTEYKENEVFLKEYTHKPTVLNGWLFAIFGLYDYIQVSSDERLDEVLSKTLKTLQNNIHKFDNGYWSMYDLNGMLTSPFYHKLHISQMSAMYNIFGLDIFKLYKLKWEKYNNKIINKSYAFIVKVIQKITE